MLNKAMVTKVLIGILVTVLGLRISDLMKARGI